MCETKIRPQKYVFLCVDAVIVSASISKRASLTAGREGSLSVGHDQQFGVCFLLSVNNDIRASVVDKLMAP